MSRFVVVEWMGDNRDQSLSRESRYSRRSGQDSLDLLHVSLGLGSLAPYKRFFEGPSFESRESHVQNYEIVYV